MSIEENDSNLDLSTSLDNGAETGDKNQEQSEDVAAIDKTAQNPDVLTAESETVRQENDSPEEVAKVSNDHTRYDNISLNAQTDNPTSSGDTSISQESRLNTFADEDNSKEPEGTATKDSVQMESDANFPIQIITNQRYTQSHPAEVINANFNHFSTKISELSAEHKDLKGKYNEQSKELDSVKEKLNLVEKRLDKLEESAKFKFDGLVKDAIRQDDEVWSEDNEECQKYIAQAKLWHSKAETLCTSVLTAISDCVSRFDQCGDLMQEINKEDATLHNSLLDRYKSLELSKKMLERLREPLDLLKKSSLPLEQLLRLQEQELVDLLRSQTDESEAKKILTKKVKETGDTRYKAVREWRDLAEKSQKQWLNFIEKKLLPALDGINEGNRYAEHLASDLINSYKIQSYQEKISAWLQTYKDLEDILLGALKSQDVTPMIVVRSQPVDYNLHEPIGTEPDANLPHESVKEITRNGYEYKLPDREPSLILRSAQIIVVKYK